LEHLIGLDGLLHQLGAVHLDGDAQSVPVNARRLGKAIGQVNYQRVVDVRLDGSFTAPEFAYRSGGLSFAVWGIRAGAGG
jgi:hypothetical protein